MTKPEPDADAAFELEARRLAARLGARGERQTAPQRHRERCSNVSLAARIVEEEPAGRLEVELRLVPRFTILAPSAPPGHELQFEPREPNTMLFSFLLSVLPFVIIAALIYFFFIRQIKMAGQGALSFGKSKARLLAKERNKTTFKDVAGIEEAIEEVSELVEFLKDPKKFQRLGGRIPKGVLMIGPPGTLLQL